MSLVPNCCPGRRVRTTVSFQIGHVLPSNGRAGAVASRSLLAAHSRTHPMAPFSSLTRFSTSNCSPSPVRPPFYHIHKTIMTKKEKRIRNNKNQAKPTGPTIGDFVMSTTLCWCLSSWKRFARLDQRGCLVEAIVGSTPPDRSWVISSYLRFAPACTLLQLSLTQIHTNKTYKRRCWWWLMRTACCLLVASWALRSDHVDDDGWLLYCDHR